MSNKRGYIQKKIAGETRHFVFSTNCWIEFCDRLGVELDKLWEYLINNKNQLKIFRELLYCSALAYCKENKLEENFDVYDVGKWMDDLSTKDANNIYECMFECSFLRADETTKDDLQVKKKKEK